MTEVKKPNYQISDRPDGFWVLLRQSNLGK